MCEKCEAVRDELMTAAREAVKRQFGSEKMPCDAAQRALLAAAVKLARDDGQMKALSGALLPLTLSLVTGLPPQMFEATGVAVGTISGGSATEPPTTH